MKSMKHSIATQVGVIFSVPLLVGMIHSAVALKAISSVLSMNILCLYVFGWVFIVRFMEFIICSL
ncbi:hypothetical protein [Kurthia gibsonii]|uniref:hypothetical protein n=1 Tax=Kurthia gibsonii TaxID=33946 RepID=UPI002DC6AB7A|nr:hypothetical protein [Kurthia gibsonii]